MRCKILRNSLIGLILLIIVFNSINSIMDEQMYFALLRAKHRVKKTEYTAYRIPYTTDSSDKPDSGTTDATDGTGLNLLLIDELEQGYLKDLLNCYRNSEYGKYDEFAIKLPVAASCGLHSVENGPYRNGFLDSYLPYTDHVIWNEVYKGESASNLTLEKFDYTVANRVGYYPKVDDPANNAVTVFQYTNNWDSRGEISKINGAGNTGRSKADHYFFPDVLATNNKYITGFIQNFLHIEDAKQEDFTAELLAAFYGIAHNRGEAGAIRSMFGFYYGNRNCPYDVQKVNKSEMLQIANSYFSYYTEYKRKNNTMQYASLPMDAQRYTYYVAVLVLGSDDWYITANYANMMKSHMSFVSEGWNGFFPNNPKTNQELIALIDSKVIDLPEAIKRKTGKTVSSSDCLKVYGTSSGGYTKNDSGAYIFKVSSIQSEVYDNKYSDGSTPYVVHSMGYIPAREALASAMGDIVYAKQLVLAGLDRIDPTNPESYYADFNKSSFKATLNYSWLSELGIDCAQLSEEQLQILDVAYNIAQLDNCVYPSSDEISKMSIEFKNKVQPTVLDCSGFVCRVLRDSGIPLNRIYTTKEIIAGVDFLQQINKNELTAGDILCYNDGMQGHVMIYLCSTSDYSGILVLDSNVTNGSLGRTGPSIRVVNNCNIADSTNVVYGKEYYCFRPIK